MFPSAILISKNRVFRLGINFTKSKFGVVLLPHISSFSRFDNSYSTEKSVIFSQLKMFKDLKLCFTPASALISSKLLMRVKSRYRSFDARSMPFNETVFPHINRNVSSSVLTNRSLKSKSAPLKSPMDKERSEAMLLKFKVPRFTLIFKLSRPEICEKSTLPM